MSSKLEAPKVNSTREFFVFSSTAKNKLAVKSLTVRPVKASERKTNSLAGIPVNHIIGFLNSSVITGKNNKLKMVNIHRIEKDLLILPVLAFSSFAYTIKGFWAETINKHVKKNTIIFARE